MAKENKAVLYSVFGKNKENSFSRWNCLEDGVALGDFNEMAYHAEYIKISALKISYSFFYSKRVSLAKRALSRFAEILAYKKVLRVTECGVRKWTVRMFVKN